MKRIKKLGKALNTEPSPISARNHRSSFSGTPRFISKQSDVCNNFTCISSEYLQKGESVSKIPTSRNRNIPFNFDINDDTQDLKNAQRATNTDLTVKF